jgi:uncharacterized protein
MLKDLIDRDRAGFEELLRRHQVSSLHGFGSSIHGPFKPESDVDLVVDIDEEDPVIFGRLMLNLWDRLEEFFGRKVDLLTLDSVDNPIMRDQIEKTKVLVYDGRKAQVLV